MAAASAGLAVTVEGVMDSGKEDEGRGGSWAGEWAHDPKFPRRSHETETFSHRPGNRSHCLSFPPFPFFFFPDSPLFIFFSLTAFFFTLLIVFIQHLMI